MTATHTAAVWEDELRDFRGRWTTLDVHTTRTFTPENPAGFTAEAEEAIKRYQSVWYHDINPPLRAGDKLGDEEGVVARELDSVIASSTVRGDALVFRGLSQRPAGLTVGAEFEDKGFVSTSLNEDFVRRIFAEGEQAVVIHIQVPAGTRGVRLNTSRTLPDYFQEDELLLGRGTRFRVIAETPGEPGQPAQLVVQVI
jgi:hypothetical protein